MTLCSIDNIAFGGEGVGRVDGLVLFVPFTLPGELTEVQIHRKKNTFAKAKLIKIIKANADRVIPPCPYFSKCGGCQLQHASYPLQLQLKKRFIEDSLKRIGKIEFDIPSVIPSSTPFAYRRHITLKLKLDGDCFKLGFTTLEGTHLPVYSCLLLNTDQDPILPFLQTLFSKIDPLLPLSESSIKILKDIHNRYLIACTFSSSLPSKELKLLKNELSLLDALSGFILKTPTQSFEAGEITPYFVHKGLTFHYSPFGFIQNHPEQSEKIYNWIVQSNLHAKKILDLYCGIGVSSLLLAKENKQVQGVELNPVSIELAIQNAKNNQINEVQFFCASAETSTRERLHIFQPDTLIVNPPKAGIPLEVLKDICKSSLTTITYISCNPPTLARDLSYLLNNGFIIENILAFDMFPQTTHVETVVKLARKKITAHF